MLTHLYVLFYQFYNDNIRLFSIFNKIFNDIMLFIHKKTIFVKKRQIDNVTQ